LSLTSGSSETLLLASGTVVVCQLKEQAWVKSLAILLLELAAPACTAESVRRAWRMT
jgi:hypothetical protein